MQLIKIHDSQPISQCCQHFIVVITWFKGLKSYWFAVQKYCAHFFKFFKISQIFGKMNISSSFENPFQNSKIMDILNKSGSSVPGGKTTTTPVKSPALTMSVSSILNSIANANSKSISKSPAKKSEIIFKNPPKDFVVGEIVSKAPYVTSSEDLRNKPVGIRAEWKTSNRFSLYPWRQVDSTTEDSPSSVAPCKIKVHFLSPEINLFFPPLRKLVNESSGVFLSVQKIRELTQSDSRPEMLRFSKRYRSAVKACAEELQDLMEKAPQEQRSMYRNFFTIFYNIECVWHLAYYTSKLNQTRL